MRVCLVRVDCGGIGEYVIGGVLVQRRRFRITSRYSSRIGHVGDTLEAQASIFVDLSVRSTFHYCGTDLNLLPYAGSDVVGENRVGVILQVVEG